MISDGLSLWPAPYFAERTETQEGYPVHKYTSIFELSNECYSEVLLICIAIMEFKTLGINVDLLYFTSSRKPLHTKAFGMSLSLELGV